MLHKPSTNAYIGEGVLNITFFPLETLMHCHYGGTNISLTQVLGTTGPKKACATAPRQEYSPNKTFPQRKTHSYILSPKSGRLIQLF